MEKIFSTRIDEDVIRQVDDYVDLTNAFELPLPLIVEACGELEKEGKVAGV